MSLEGKDEEAVAALEGQLLTKLKELGGSSGNGALQRALNWDEGQYWPVRNRIYDRGLLTLGRGRGGSVSLAAAQAQPAAEPEAPAQHPPAQEADLYEPIATVLRDAWVKDYRLRHVRVEVTAAQGRRQTGGTWTRPDLVVVGLRVFPHLPGKYLDLFTIEVKPDWAVDVTAVYEALAHRRAATHALVWLHIPHGRAAALGDAVEAVCSEAKRFGIGVIVASEPDNYESWDVRVEPTRSEPDPEALNDFITVQLSPATKEDIVAWVR